MTNPFDRALYLGYDIDDRAAYATKRRFLGASRDSYVSAFIFFFFMRRYKTRDKQKCSNQK